ncbi:hypothetical protein VTO42DRAFT_1980 [Malbranchea cinnamomea]
MSYDRVLPKPPALYHDRSGRDLLVRTNPSLGDEIMGGTSMLPIRPNDGHRLLSDINIGNGRSVGQQAPTSSESSPASPKRPPVTQVAAVLASPVPQKRPLSVITSDSATQQSETSSNSSISSSSRDAIVQFCLCQPDPKIPRPRNSFILFRQHTQAEVAAQHPGLPNPDISKIIGKRWRTLSDEVKLEWKHLAEEEKLRHMQRYPGYQYKPSRGGKKGRNANTSHLSGSDISTSPSGVSVCNRCGGRIMNPPSTPTTPLSSSAKPNSDDNTLSSKPNPPGPRSLVGGYSNEGWRTPSPMQTSGNTDRRPVAAHRLLQENECVLPDFKRRKFNVSGTYFPIRRELSPDSPYTPRTSPLPHPDCLAPGWPHTLAPPSRSYRVPSTQQSVHDPSLTLPPLQTLSLSQQCLQNPFSVETMVMNIPFINKIKILSMISPPLSESPIGRGAVVAVEGLNLDAVKCVVQYLHNTLSKSHSVREFTGPELKSLGSSNASNETGDTTVQYLHYHRTISSWLNISGEIVDFISHNPYKEERLRNISKPEGGGLPIANSDGETITSAPAASAEERLSEPFRIALVSRYQLTTTDVHACTMPIRDSYAPTDHWQWMASLWRGCIGPDITIVIHDCEKNELERLGGVGSNPVENRLGDARTLVIRRPAGSSSTAIIEDRALRRVGFEVEESLRR